ncbi:MAG: 2-oxo acid dehydrogenase subunit E2 [Betaproteobacteria bacterium]|nr:2-oxo acid dehydrogenase subunit E2 [Betaproteobacteria bacterium]
MAEPIYVPKINNNDDEVKLIGVDISVGDFVDAGQVIAQIETDKAVVDLESNNEGYVLVINGELESILQVGDVFVWLGQSKDEAIPESNKKNNSVQSAQQSSAPTAKAKILLQKYNLKADDIPASGTRLSASDVQDYVSNLGHGSSPQRSSPQNMPAKTITAEETKPIVSGTEIALKSHERGMLSTVTWHRDVAAAGYIELPYDQSFWEAYSQSFGNQHGLLLSPLLPLMAWRLVELCAENPRINATISEMKRYEYDQTNLGFTIQSGNILYLAVIEAANQLDELSFVNRMIELQRNAASHKLNPNELQNATIGFSSMARWKVGRHIPILSPHTTMMIAHTVDTNGQAVLGASYDHRVLHGGDVVNTLQKLSKPKPSN